ISRTPLAGKQTLDAKGLVVAPGFIDIHAHGQQLAAARMQAFDGVTTALELESGVLPVAGAYEQMAKEGRPINYGVSAAWVFARIAEKTRTEPEPSLGYFQKAQSSKEWQNSLATARGAAAHPRARGAGAQRGRARHRHQRGVRAGVRAQGVLRARATRQEVRRADLHARPLSERHRATLVVRGVRGADLARRVDGGAYAHLPPEQHQHARHPTDRGADPR